MSDDSREEEPVLTTAPKNNRKITEFMRPTKSAQMNEKLIRKQETMDLLRN
jgi:hypothetical protein